MKILVTGATGLIGRLLCKELLYKGHDLVVVGRSPESQFRKSFSLPCKYYTWETLYPSKVDAVFHLAGDPIASARWSKKKKNSILQSRLKTTETLIKAFRGQWPKVVIGASAIGFYGDRQSTNLSEDAPKGAGFLANVCHQWEQSYQEFESHSRLVKIRIGLVLDSSGGFLSPMETLFSLGLGGVVGHGCQYMSWIHSEDLVRALMFSLETPSMKGVFNAVSPNPVTNAEWTQIYAKQIKRWAILPAPSFALKLILGEMSQLALHGQHVSSQKLTSAGFQFKFKTLKETLANLYHWKSHPMDFAFQSEQWIPSPPKDVFPFFGEAKNLEQITPPWLKFQILKQPEGSIDSGAIIDYKISLKGLPIKWRTKIEHWHPPSKFSDTQLKGPYRKWVHMHNFKELQGGTLMIDHVTYRLPLNLPGQIIAGRYVKSDISRIFAYRRKIIQKLWKKL